MTKILCILKAYFTKSCFTSFFKKMCMYSLAVVKVYKEKKKQVYLCLLDKVLSLNGYQTMKPQNMKYLKPLAIIRDMLYTLC